MTITITGRHMELTDNLKDHINKKMKKLERYFHQVIDVHVILYIEKLNHVVEININGDGIQFHAIEKAGDMYSSVDLLSDKIEKQINRYKERHTEHKVTTKEIQQKLETKTDNGRSVVLNQVSHKPIDAVEAFLEMKLGNKDFILFKKGETESEGEKSYFNRNYAVIYKCGDSHRMVEIPFEMIKENSFDPQQFIEYELRVQNDSTTNPQIDFIRNNSCGTSCLSVHEAMDALMKSSDKFMTFFNIESRYFNVIYRKGNEIELMVPTF